MKNIRVNEIKDIYNEKIKLDKKERPLDLLELIKYKRNKRKVEYLLSQIENQLDNINLLYGQIYLDIFIDRYINNKSVVYLANKYNMGRSSIYRMINKAKDIFENK